LPISAAAVAASVRPIGDSGPEERDWRGVEDCGSACDKDVAAVSSFELRCLKGDNFCSCSNILNDVVQGSVSFW
jgi:hypothetical protein